MSEEEGGGGWLGSALSWGSRAVHAAEGLGLPKMALEAFKASKGVSGAVEKGMPILGGILSGGQALYEGHEAYENFSKFGSHCDTAWNNVGGTILGGAGVGIAAAGTAGAPYGLALAAGEGVADVAGQAAAWGFGKKAGFSADNIVGGLARGLAGDRSLGSSVSNALGGGFWGGAAGTATNILAAPVNLMSTIGGGIANEIGAIGSGIMNGEGAIGGAIHGIGAGIGSAAHAIADW
jgi:hypothetical protein